MTDEQEKEPPSLKELLGAAVRLLKQERKCLVSKHHPSVLRGSKSGKFNTVLNLALLGFR